MGSVGCGVCWSSEAREAYERATKARIETYLIDESHFIVSIRLCAACGQRYLQVMTETIDWEDGEDPVSRILLPILPAERDALVQATPPSIGQLNGLGKGRRSVWYDWPKGEPPTVWWGVGVEVGPHD